MFTMLALAGQLLAGELNEPPPRAEPVKLLPVWVAPVSGGVSQTLAVAILFSMAIAHPCGPPPTKDPCPFGPNFTNGLFFSTIAIHAVTLVATVALAIINAVRVGEAKKSAVIFDGVAFHF